jgi:hypothetical protein
MYQSRDDMTILEIKIIMGAKDVCGNNRGKMISVLLIVSAMDIKLKGNFQTSNKILPTINVNHTFRIGITKVRVMWWSIVNHGLINWVGSPIRKYTSRQARYHFLNL